MANYRAIATGLWSAGATWAGGAVPPNGEGHNIYSNSFTVTIDTAVNVALLTNAAITASFVGGGTSAAALGGFVANSNFNITANIAHNASGANPSTLKIESTATFQLTGNINGNSLAGSLSSSPVTHSGSGTVSIIGNVNVGIANGTPGIINNSSSGTISLLGNVEGYNFSANSGSILNTSTGTCSVEGNLIVGKSQNAIMNTGGGTINYTGNATGGATGGGIPIANTSAGFVNVTGNLTGGSTTVALSNTSALATITVNGVLTAAPSSAAIQSTAGGTLRLNCSFISAVNGRVPVYAPAFILFNTPASARTRYALNGTGTYVDMFTADNTGLGPATNNVRSGVTYSGMTGTLAVPLPSQVAVGVATDHTVGTAFVTGSDIATAVWSAASRTITGGLVDTATTLTNTPNVPTTSQIASQVRTELSSELAKVSALNLTRLGQVTTTEILGNLLSQANS
jgi:hypothetical protein